MKPLGILMLDTRFPRIEGDIGNAVQIVHDDEIRLTVAVKVSTDERRGSDASETQGRGHEVPAGDADQFRDII